jgi:deoxyribodipyrimidine photolyase-related protein
MNATLVLGNQLFEPRWLGNTSLVFMREDPELCTHYRYHKQKILFFLSAMRKHAETLKRAGIEVHYEKLGQGASTYEESLIDFLKKRKPTSLQLFEIEDKFFESRILRTLNKAQIPTRTLSSPMFLTSRGEFKNYLGCTKRPFMKSFYEEQRKRLGILVEKDGEPVGGKWSFDEDNRKPLPKNYQPVMPPAYAMDKIDLEVASLVAERFHDHPGSVEDFWLPTSRPEALQWLRSFLEARFREFGPFEDALSRKHSFLNHSLLTPYLNTGLLTPDEVISSALKTARAQKIPLNSCEGFIRQVIGWREFIRGVYQNYSERQENTNFFNHTRKLNPLWYTGKTGIAPLDDMIRKCLRSGYAHHIERLMIAGSLMLLLEIDPQEAHRWFMELFIDSSDWVMGPNVYGMALFSDGGIFATKPYICGSNYYKKMGGYSSGDWQEGVDGLYWSFIEKQKSFFLKNPRTAMAARTVEKMPAEKKERLFKRAHELRDQLTTVI